MNTSDNRYNVDYRYGHDGERTVKHSVSKGGGSHGETMYFNKMWSWRYDGSQYSIVGQNSKHVYLGDTRIATKIFRSDGAEYTEEESVKQYYYHSDHLGSAQLITNYQGDEYERLEYTPYGEVWTEKVNDTASMLDIPYRFTGKEQDEETGLYYYGARYQDPKTSRWLSTDPALSSYLPTAGGDNSQLPGMGGIYNTVNMHLYHYAGNNPVKYTDPTGSIVEEVDGSLYQQSSVTQLGNEDGVTIKAEGCVLTAVTRIASAISGTSISLDRANQMALDKELYSGKGGDLSVENQAKLIGFLTGETIDYRTVSGDQWQVAGEIGRLEESDTSYFVTGRMSITDSNGNYSGKHTVNVSSAENASWGGTIINIKDTSNTNRTSTQGHAENANGFIVAEGIYSIHIFSVAEDLND